MNKETYNTETGHDTEAGIWKGQISLLNFCTSFSLSHNALTGSLWIAQGQLRVVKRNNFTSLLGCACVAIQICSAHCSASGAEGFFSSTILSVAVGSDWLWKAMVRSVDESI